MIKPSSETNSFKQQTESPTLPLSPSDKMGAQGTTTSSCQHQRGDERDKRWARATKLPSSCHLNHLFLLLSLLSLQILKSSSTILHNSNQATGPGETHLAGQMFTCGKLYYRTFYMDQQRNVLYVGAM